MSAILTKICELDLVHHHVILPATVEACQCVLLWVETHLGMDIGDGDGDGDGD